MSYRFRTGEKGELVLQVLKERINRGSLYQPDPEWRDAGVADIPVNDPFRIGQIGGGSWSVINSAGDEVWHRS